MYWLLIQRYLSDKCTPQEKKQVEQWTAANSKNKELVNSLKKIWEIDHENDIEVDVDIAWQRVEEKMPGSNVYHKRTSEIQSAKSTQKNSYLIKFAVAASVIFVALFAYQYYPINQTRVDIAGSQKVEMQIYETGNGQRTTLQLSDGSIIYLNVASSLKISPHYGDTLRTVYLEGEAYFEVNRDPGKPFIVKSNNSVIEVLGTKFNVRAYSAGSLTQVVVKEGTVALKENSKRPTGKSIITKNQIGVLNNEGEVEIENVKNFDLHLGWMEGRLVFDSTPLEDMIVKLERWYDVDIAITDSELRSQPITATFEKDTIDEVLEVIAKSLDVNYRKNGRNIQFIP